MTEKQALQRIVVVLSEDSTRSTFEKEFERITGCIEPIEFEDGYTQYDVIERRPNPKFS